MRLTGKAIEFGLACSYRTNSYVLKRKSIASLIEKLPAIRHEGIGLENWLRRPENNVEKLPAEIREGYSAEIWNYLETELKFEGYLKREELQIERAKKQEEWKLSDQIDYHSISSLSSEARQKLTEYKPTSLRHALRISGVTPADIDVLSLWLKKKEKI